MSRPFNVGLPRRGFTPTLIADPPIPSSRCQGCVNIPDSLQTDGSQTDLKNHVRTWTSYPELDRSASTGCDLCLMVKHYVQERYEPKIPLDVPLVCAEVDPTRGLEVKFVGKTSKIEIFKRDAPSLQQQQLQSDKGKHRRYESIGQAKRLLTDCLSEPTHSRCQESYASLRAKETSQLPRRLLDLSHGSTIYVFNTQLWALRGTVTLSEVAEYATLSYRWGVTDHEYVLKQSFSDHIELGLDSMPQTFKDAIATTRGLGIRFLWIDALCIVQPGGVHDTSDWNAEGPRMGLIYNNGVCTISATSGGTVHDGFLSKVGNEIALAAPVPLRTTRGGRLQWFGRSALRMENAVSRSTLNQRGWVSQERALSRRLIHFTTKGVFFECQNSISTHSFYGSITEGINVFSKRLQNDQVWEPPIKTWHRFVAEYSGYQFTDIQDRLVALSSVAKVTQTFMANDLYCAGMWKSNILRDMLWYVEGSQVIDCEARIDTTPSWSWVSVSKRITYTHPNRRANMLSKVVKLDFDLTRPENPFGNIEDWRLRLHGALTQHSMLFLQKVTRWDEVRTFSQAEKLPVLLVYVDYVAYEGSKDKRLTFYGLVLHRVLPWTDDVEAVPEYRRIGLAIWGVQDQGTGVPTLNTVGDLFKQELRTVDLV